MGRCERDQGFSGSALGLGKQHCWGWGFQACVHLLEKHRMRMEFGLGRCIEQRVYRELYSDCSSIEGKHYEPIFFHWISERLILKNSTTTTIFLFFFRPRITKVHFKETQFELRVLGKDVSFCLAHSLAEQGDLVSSLITAKTWWSMTAVFSSAATTWNLVTGLSAQLLKEGQGRNEWVGNGEMSL